MASVESTGLIQQTYKGIIVQNGLSGMVYLPIDFHAFMNCHTSAIELYSGDVDGFELPPFFEDRPGSKAIGAHVSIISVSEAKTHKIVLSKGETREVELKFCETTVVKPENWRGVSEIITLRVECEDFRQLREQYGLPPNKFPFSLTLAVKHSISHPQKLSRVTPVLKSSEHSAALLEIMKGTYSGTVMQHATSSFIYLNIDDAFYDRWRKIPETRGYDIPYFWTYSGVGLHATVVSAAEARNSYVRLGEWQGKSLEFNVTGFKEVDTPRWDNVQKAINLTIDCPSITMFRQMHDLPFCMEPHITIGVVFSPWKDSFIHPVSCQSDCDTSMLMSLQLKRSYSDDDDY